MTVSIAAKEAASNKSAKPRLVRAVCRRFGKSTVAFYSREKKRLRKAVDTETVVKHVNAVRKEMPFLGGRKTFHLIKGKLSDNGVNIGRDKFFEILRMEDLLIKRRRAFVPKTTKFDPNLPVARNLVKDIVVDSPNQVHVSDITYIKVGDHYAYLSLVSDRFCRDIIGWYLSDNLKSTGPIKALKMAAKVVPAGTSVIEHSDRGCQYASKAYRKLVTRLGCRPSMTEERHCYENGAAERVNGILKHEFALDRCFRTFSEAKRAICEAITAYNTKRPHEMLGMMTPAEARANPELARPKALHAFESAKKVSQRAKAKRERARKAA